MKEKKSSEKTEGKKKWCQEQTYAGKKGEIIIDSKEN
jgi:hypothetical protein